MMKAVFTFGFVLIGWIAAGPVSGFGQAAAPVWEWPVSSPEAQGIDGARIAALAGEIRRGELCPRTHALLIVRHGAIVIEEYFNDWRADKIHTLQSVSKSITSALVGIAIARGELKGVREKVLDSFPDLKDIANLDDRKRGLRLEDILTMRTGTDYHERGAGSPHEQLSRLLKGWDKFYLDRPMIQPPGTGFNYDSGGVILISSMLKNRTGLHALDYAKRHLFKPLGIEKFIWLQNLEGQTHCGGGLALTARDMAKFGLLYLRNGRWGEEQVVPESWVRDSCRLHVDLAGPGQPRGGYGYLWWIGAPDPRGKGELDIPYARGRFGQYIFVIPEHDMVVVFLSMAQTSPEMAKPIEVMYDRILTAVEE